MAACGRHSAGERQGGRRWPCLASLLPAAAAAAVLLAGLAPASAGGGRPAGQTSALVPAPAQGVLPAGSFLVADAYEGPDNTAPRKTHRPSIKRTRHTAGTTKRPAPSASRPAKGTPAKALAPKPAPTGTGASRSADPPKAADGGTTGGADAQPPAAATMAAAGGPTEPGRISINFANTDVKQALASIGAYARTDIMLTPGTTGAVSINLRNRTPDEAIRLVAAAAGLEVAKVGDSYVVGPGPEVAKATSQFGKREVMALKYAAPADVKDALLHTVPRLSVEAGNGAVIVSGLPDDLAAARAAVAQLDVAPAPPPAPKAATDVAVLRYADPEATEKMCRAAFPDVKITRTDRTMAFSGPPDEVQGVAKIIKAADVEPPKPELPKTADQKETYVYRLKYLNAKRAEESLKKLLPNLTVAAGPEPTAPPAANFQPLSLSMLGSSSGGGSGFWSTGGTTMGAGAVGTAGAEAQPLSRSPYLVMVGAPADIAVARQILEQTDTPTPLVRIQAAMLEVNRTLLDQLGIRWDFTNTTETFTVPGGGGLHFDKLRFSDLSFSATIDALINDSRARLLASPNISVVDNEDANIFIGDLLRFRGINVVTPNAGTVQGTETIPVGIALLVRPHIHPTGDVTLKVHPVVSTVTSFVDGLPQTASREADTTVRLGSGEQLVIGGLNRDDFTKTVQRVPLLSSIPIIGELFKSTTKSTNRTEIIVVIRAYPVTTEPAPAPQFPAAPTPIP